MSGPRWIPLAYRMGPEEEVLQQVLARLESVEAEPGACVVLPEYLAYTREASRRALEALARTAPRLGLNLVTTLNLVPEENGLRLPGAEPGAAYNTLVVVTRHGELHAPQAKVTVQSFEQRRYDPRFAEIGVRPYRRLHRVRLQPAGAGEPVTAVFLVCSDLALPLVAVEEVEALAARTVVVPGNFGRGAERAAREVLELFLGPLWQESVFVNAYQEELPGRPPVARRVEEVRLAPAATPPLPGPFQRLRLFRRDAVVYPDEAAPNFVRMAELTDRDGGRFSIPMSVLDIEPVVDDYPWTIRL
ncbi:MAG: hypothetical protein IRZ26_04435 [Clostridia bacterium]|nr:hypothetical protein [Clostridia bacterium]MCL6521650.1 hypothetical protein [Bacillota bacterium]